MMPVVVDKSGTAGDVGSGSVGTRGSFLFSPTARGLSDENFKGVRTATTNFISGYKENILLETTTGSPYLWRRIVFAMKGPMIRDLYQGHVINYHTMAPEVAGEPLRALGIMPDDVYNRFTQFLFDGAEYTDWWDVNTAPVDTERVTVLYDKKVNINPTNDAGRALDRKWWLPIRKNIVYGANGPISGPWNDDLDQWYSGSGKAGIGDIYIWDNFTRVGSQTNGTLNFAPQGTYYWHER